MTTPPVTEGGARMEQETAGASSLRSDAELLDVLRAAYTCYRNGRTDQGEYSLVEAIEMVLRGSEATRQEVSHAAASRGVTQETPDSYWRQKAKHLAALMGIAGAKLCLPVSEQNIRDAKQALDVAPHVMLEIIREDKLGASRGVEATTADTERLDHVLNEWVEIEHDKETGERRIRCQAFCSEWFACSPRQYIDTQRAARGGSVAQPVAFTECPACLGRFVKCSAECPRSGRDDCRYCYEFRARGESGARRGEDESAGVGRSAAGVATPDGRTLTDETGTGDVLGSKLASRHVQPGPLGQLRANDQEADAINPTSSTSPASAPERCPTCSSDLKDLPSFKLSCEDAWHRRASAPQQDVTRDTQRLEYVRAHTAVYFDQDNGATVCETLDEFRARIDAEMRSGSPETPGERAHG